ncbi:MAG: FdtA/QdtA family cupin domain-containing protein [Balneolaceae bacterium]|nr:FdtA/QdtA family cupin domain-containing protein [Balneolaceae bacterium]
MSEVKLISLPKFLDPRGNLTFLQDNEHIPFKIKRVFWTYDVPGGELRGGHAYKSQHEVIIALSGSFDVVVESDERSEVYSLNRSYNALYIPSRTWRHMQNFSTNALSLHLSSHVYSADDYIFDKREVSN